MPFKPTRFDVVFVHRHPAFDIRPRAFDVHKLFAEYINAEINVQNPPPNSPAAAPRFQLADGKRTLIGANNLAQLTLDFSTGLPTGQTWMSVLSKPASLMDQMDSYLTPGFPGFKSLFFQIARPYDGDQTDIAKIIQSLFAKHPVGHIDSAGYTAATADEHFVRNYEISQFKFWEFSGVVPPSGVVDLDLDFTPPTQEGLQIKLEAKDKFKDTPIAGCSFKQLVSIIGEMLDDPLVARLMTADGQ